MKKIILFALVVVAAVLMMGYHFLTSEFSGLDIMITNKTNLDLDNITIKTLEGNDHVITKIKPGDAYFIDNYQYESEMDDALILVYKDNDGNEHQEIPLGYLDGVFSAKFDIRILDIDDNGLLDMDVSIEF